jgi:hypothetical protein
MSLAAGKNTFAKRGGLYVEILSSPFRN